MGVVVGQRTNPRDNRNSWLIWLRYTSFIVPLRTGSSQGVVLGHEWWLGEYLYAPNVCPQLCLSLCVLSISDPSKDLQLKNLD